MTSRRFLLLDTFNLFYRAFYALPASLTSPGGSPVNAVYGVVSMLLNLRETTHPDFTIATLESLVPSKRKQTYAQYKAQRKPMPAELKSQIPVLLNILEALKIPCISSPEYEADDVAGTLASQLSREGDVTIVSNDQDLWQLVSNRVTILLPKKGGKVSQLVTPKFVLDTLGIYPEQVPDYKGLVGDTSDNIPGVPGIGSVTARKLLRRFGSLSAIYDAVYRDEISDIRPSILAKLKAGKDSAFMSRDLALIDTNVPISISLADLPTDTFDVSSPGFHELLETLAFRSLLNRVRPHNFAQNTEFSHPSLF